MRRSRRAGAPQPLGGAGDAAAPRAVTIDKSNKNVTDLSAVMRPVSE
jgi:hypothetical protein